MKKDYKKLDMDVILMEKEDVITASGVSEPKVSELIPDWN